MGLGSKNRVPSYEALLLLCCAVTCGCYLGSHMRIPVVPLFARTMGADTFQVGMINASFLLMAALLSLPLGVLSDRLGRKRLIMGGLLIISLSSFLLCFSTSVLEMIGVYLLFGIGLAAFAPTMMSFVADFSPPTHLGRSYGWYTLALYGGMSTGPALGGAIAGWVGFQSTFIASGAITFAVFFMVLCFLPRARQVLVNRPPKRATGDVARDLMKNAPLLACWLATLGGCLGLGMFVTFVPLYAQDQGVKVGQIGLIFGSQALCNALSRIPFGRLSDRVSKRSHLVTAGLIGFSVSIAGLGMAQGMLYAYLVRCGGRYQHGDSLHGSRRAHFGSGAPRCQGACHGRLQQRDLHRDDAQLARNGSGDSGDRIQKRFCHCGDDQPCGNGVVSPGVQPSCSTTIIATTAASQRRCAGGPEPPSTWTAVQVFNSSCGF